MKYVAEIEDLDTGCTYIKTGENLKECVDSFLSMFFGKKRYKILWSKTRSHSIRD